MARHNTFRLPPSAQMFAGATAIARPTSARAQGFHCIPAQPTAAALAGLARAVTAGDAFCVTDHPLRGPTVAPTDFVTLTGGSTGAPKAVLRTQASWIASFEINAQRFDLAARRGLAVLGALSHSLALYGVLEGVHAGLPVHVLDGLPAAAQRDILRARRVEVIYATPSQLNMLGATRADPLQDVRLILCGGGALTGTTRDAVRKLCPHAALHQFYGAAETSFVTMTNADTPEGAVGPAFAAVEITLDAGEVWVRSPYLFKGYLTDTGHDARWRDGFLSVGELGEMDARGNLWITGRASRQVNVADTLVSPEAVERFVASHPSGSACAVLPVPDPLRGHRLALVLEGAQDAARAQVLTQACRDRFGPLIAPRAVYFHPQLPLLPSGKPDLDRLSKWMDSQP